MIIVLVLFFSVGELVEQFIQELVQRDGILRRERDAAADLLRYANRLFAELQAVPGDLHQQDAFVLQRAKTAQIAFLLQIFQHECQGA